MSWTPLIHRLAYLPLILAGPILRRTEPDRVTVWVALRKPCYEVKLRVYATDTEHEVVADYPLLEGSGATVSLGRNLHVLAVTATPRGSDRLQPGQIYAYNLNFAGHDGGLVRALNSESHLPNVTVSYFDHQLPTFSLPPSDLNQLQIVHGSCRKPHGGGLDALPILDDLVAQHASQPDGRPHQLFFTGDQIYGDDVADPLLQAVIDAASTLLGWEEVLPLGNKSQKSSEIKPGDRSDIAHDFAGFTAMLVDQPQKAKSHLFSFGEYCTMYLFSWSQVLWPPLFPPGKKICQNSRQAKLWDEEVEAIQNFGRELWKVRRVLANVPTYTICDDHDITDDWYLNREWCNRVLGKPLGRQAVQNGLLAYALFQAWGNTPEQFSLGQPGEKLLRATQNWSISAGRDKLAWEEIGKYVGIPPLDQETGLPKYKLDGDVLILDRDYPDGTKPLRWHYKVRSSHHEAIVLDTRTWRGYPSGDPMEPPMLLCPRAFEEQICQALEESAGDIAATIAILPTNLVSLAVIDLVQRLHLSQGKVFGSDVGDAWNFHEAAFTQLLAELFKRRDRVIILSGDIHYACAVRLDYWVRCHFGGVKNLETPEQPKVLAQLTSSGFKNDELKTNLAHTKMKSLFPEPTQDWLGWNEPPQLVEIQTMPDKVRAIDLVLPDCKPTIRQLKSRRGNEEFAWEILVKNPESLPDWRYHIEWIKREKWQELEGDYQPVYSEQKSSLSGLKIKELPKAIASLWQNQWFQEGDEVVGYNNVGLIRFQSSPEREPAVIQDIYWRPSWQPNRIVFSRYFVSLRLPEPPPQPKVFLPD